MERIAAGRKELDETVMATLSDEQREKFDELKGEPFELSMEKIMRSRFGRGGPGGGRGGQGGARGRRGGDREGGGRERRRPTRPDSGDDDSSEADSK